MSENLRNAAVFLIQTLFDLTIFIVLVRIILVAVHADYFNPITQVIIKLTKPLASLRRVIPNLKRIELGSILVLLILEALKFLSLSFLIYGGMPAPLGLLVLSIADALRSLLNLFFYAILLQAIISWVQHGYSPIGNLLAKITAPIIYPIRRILPPLGGMDFSAIPAMIILQLIIILFITPLMATGNTLAFS